MRALVLPPASACSGWLLRSSAAGSHSTPFIHALSYQLPWTSWQGRRGQEKEGGFLFFQALLIWSLAGVMISLSNFLGPRCHFHFVA